ncbi:hypothetical protein SAMN05421863_110311 [Nitrosomonas communis]|uniref:Uncharacterized protein n=1 Tax=Nitrosomonas communis TaxID=44574 RepID=A0A1I4WAZ5_9PROT|nr:hypothetical protein SAMN05421863_110311 [Nitrosomonas communis]
MVDTSRDEALFQYSFIIRKLGSSYCFLCRTHVSQLNIKNNSLYLDTSDASHAFLSRWAATKHEWQIPHEKQESKNLKKLKIFYPNSPFPNFLEFQIFSISGLAPPPSISTDDLQNALTLGVIHPADMRNGVKDYIAEQERNVLY